MAETTSMTLAQLVDLSLCSTEMGTVNFSILHALLHVLLQQMNRADVTVEFVGKDSDRIQNLLKAAKPLPCVTLTEYKIVGDQRVKKDTDEDEPADKALVVVEQGGATADISVGMTKQFQEIQNDVNSLKNQLKELRELPGNVDLIEATRDKSSPILNMFQVLTVTKRVEGIEAGFERISSLVEDLINSMGGDAVRTTVRNVRRSIESMVRDEIGKMVTRAEDIAERVDSRTLIEESIRHELEKIVAKIEGSYDEEEEKEAKPKAGDNITNKINELYKKIEEITKKIEELAGGASAKDFADLTERLNVDQAKIRELSDSLRSLLNQVQAMKEINAKIIEDAELIKKSNEAILEEIEFLKITKANHEDLQDALENKADTCELNRKVSNDVFELTCDEFSKAIEDALNRLSQQEQLLLQALDSMQQEIGGKLDKADVDKFKEFINDQLKDIQNKLKLLKSLKADEEAAGTKRKLLRDLNCISCEKDVVMRKDLDTNLKSTANPLPPPARNIAPYIAYELDQLRTQQKTLGIGKNLNHLEMAFKTSKENKKQDHLCTRYCGGSHTVTTAEQRVTKVGHFTQQWGVKVEPALDDKYIRGIDNHLYKADPEVDKPKRPATAVTERKKTSKPNVIQNGTATPRYPTRRDDATEANEEEAIQSTEVLISENAAKLSVESVKKNPSQVSNTAQNNPGE